MKRLFALLLLLPTLALGAPNDLVISQRNSDDSGLTPSRRISPPTDGSNALLAYMGGTQQIPVMWKLGTGLTMQNGVLSVTPAEPQAVAWVSVTGKPAAYPSTIPLVSGLQSALDGKLSAPAGTTSQYLRGDGTLASFPAIPAAQVRSDWNATTGLAAIDNRPNLAPVATAGAYASLTGIPATFAPTAHTQAWSTITSTPTTLAGYGIQDGVSQSALSGYATAGALTSGLATKFNTPTGTTAQYVRGDGSLATLPTASARVFTNPTRALNTAFQISTTRDVSVVYTVDISVTSLLLGGTSGRVLLEYADDQAFSTNVVTVNSSPNATGGVLNVTNLGPGNVSGWVPAGKWVRIRTANVTGSPVYTFVGSQEVLQ